MTREAETSLGSRHLEAGTSRREDPDDDHDKVDNAAIDDDDEGEICTSGSASISLSLNLEAEIGRASWWGRGFWSIEGCAWAGG